MDPLTLLGILGALIIVVVANIMEGGNPMNLLLIPPMLLVLGGTVLVSLAGYTMPDAKKIPRTIVKAFKGSSGRPGDVIPTLVEMADKARKDGLLALESSLDSIDDPFMRKGLTMVVDGQDADDIAEILESSMQAKRAETKAEAKFWTEAGSYAPTIGIVGTVMGLVHVLENLANPEELGHLIAAAFVATLWGVLSANIIFLPIASRLKRLGELEIERMEVALEGILAIQAGTSSRLIGEKLRALAGEEEQKAA